MIKMYCILVDEKDAKSSSLAEDEPEVGNEDCDDDDTEKYSRSRKTGSSAGGLRHRQQKNLRKAAPVPVPQDQTEFPSISGDQVNNFLAKSYGEVSGHAGGALRTAVINDARTRGKSVDQTGGILFSEPVVQSSYVWKKTPDLSGPSKSSEIRQTVVPSLYDSMIRNNADAFISVNEATGATNSESQVLGKEPSKQGRSNSDHDEFRGRSDSDDVFMSSDRNAITTSAPLAEGWEEVNKKHSSVICNYLTAFRSRFLNQRGAEYIITTRRQGSRGMKLQRLSSYFDFI